MLLRAVFVLALALFVSFPPVVARGSGARPQAAGLLLFNGKVFTADERGSLAEAVAVEGSRVVAVGTTRELRARYPRARAIDLGGRLVTPGFNDAHIHFLGGGLSLLRVDLNGARTLEEAKRRVAARAKELPAGAWVTGRGWDHTLWGGEWPTKEALDEAAPDHPVFLQRVDGHVSWANSLALRKANVTRETRAPEGGEILRDARGEPTGILKETAAGLVARVVPDPTAAEMLTAIERALAEARRYGITSIQDNSGYETTKLYRRLKAEGKLTVRVSEWQNFEDTVEELKRQRAEFLAFNDLPERLRLGPLKGYVDGTLGSRTAAMLAPFADDPANSGIPRRPPEELKRMIAERAAEGFQIALHAIGDRANRIALDGFEEALRQNLSPNYYRASREDIPIQRGETPETRSHFLTSWVRFRLEHAQVVAPTDFARFRDLEVVASMQPSHAISDKRWAQDRLGEYRVLGAYSWHTMLAHGVRVAFGTDWPVEPISPYLGLYAAVTRRSTDGDPPGGWWPQERLSMAEAIRCYTAGSAYASFDEGQKGRIAVGMLADLVVHSQDLLTIKPEEVLNTEPVLTVFDGRVIYEKK
ncbi:MAG TPA: amidohydrolase [Pyrinomonadaceae bacterium]|nr:amidohydrolase [Pyrinomonadaceae bacterium]